MTWKELKHHIEVMDDEQANTDITIYFRDIDEFFHANGYDIAKDLCELDENHPYLFV